MLHRLGSSPAPGSVQPAGAGTNPDSLSQRSNHSDNSAKRRDPGTLQRTGSVKRTLPSATIGMQNKGGNAGSDDHSLLDDDVLLSGLGWEMTNDREDSSAHGSFAVAAAIRRAEGGSTPNASELASMARVGLDLATDASVTGGFSAAAALGGDCVTHAPAADYTVGCAPTLGACNARLSMGTKPGPEQQQHGVSAGPVLCMESMGGERLVVHGSGSSGLMLPPASPRWVLASVDSSVRGASAASAALQLSSGGSAGQESLPGRLLPDCERSAPGVLPDDGMQEGPPSQAAGALPEYPAEPSGAAHLPPHWPSPQGRAAEAPPSARRPNSSGQMSAELQTERQWQQLAERSRRLEVVIREKQQLEAALQQCACRLQEAQGLLRCKLCCSARRNCVLLPCMHFSYCHTCIAAHCARDAHCPACNSLVSGFQTLLLID